MARIHSCQLSSDAPTLAVVQILVSHDTNIRIIGMGSFMTVATDLGDVDIEGVDFAFEDRPDIHEVLEGLRELKSHAVVPFAGVKAVLLLTNDLVAAAFKDEEVFPASAIYPMTTGPVLGKTLQCMAGDEHRKNRALVSPSFQRKRVAEFIEPLL